jgi:GNAT superfamily N-acetyltransferase
VERSIRHSLCFGAFEGGRQVGFARVISDRATFAYVSDVFVLESHRGRGIGTRIMDCITSHPELQNLRLWTLFTRDAHGLYRQHGFSEARYPDRLMERRRESPYALSATGDFREGTS